MTRQQDGWIAIDGNEYLGETPMWSAAEQALFWVSCEDPPLLCRWEPGRSDLESWPMPDRIGGLALRADGSLVVCVGSALYIFDRATGELSLLAHRRSGRTSSSMRPASIPPAGSGLVAMMNVSASTT